MKSRFVFVISGRPLFRESLKYLIEKVGLARVITAPTEEGAERLADDFAPDVVVIDRGDTGANNLTRFFHKPDKPAKVIVLGWNDDRLAVYSRWPVLPATCENLIRAITEPTFSGQPTQDGTEVVEELRSLGSGSRVKSDHSDI